MGGRSRIRYQGVVRVRINIDVASGIDDGIIPHSGDGRIIDIRGGAGTGQGQESFGGAPCRGEIKQEVVCYSFNPDILL